MSRHTAGPWSAPYYEDTEGDEGWWIHNGKEGADEFAVAVTFSLNPNGEADARLIAAAPDLLEALIAARAELAGLPHSLGYDFTHLPKIDAAIARATQPLPTMSEVES